jgi:hypothetical protein
MSAMQPSDFAAAVQDDQFEALRKYMSSGERRNNRNNQIRDFEQMLQVIRQYVERGDEYDTNRRAQVGICFLTGAVAINIEIFKRLTTKSKSSLNGTLKKLEYKRINFPDHPDLVSELERKIPILALNHHERQQWSIRIVPSVPDLIIPLIGPVKPHEDVIDDHLPQMTLDSGYHFDFNFGFNFGFGFDLDSRFDDGNDDCRNIEDEYSYE